MVYQYDVKFRFSNGFDDSLVDWEKSLTVIRHFLAHLFIEIASSIMSPPGKLIQFHNCTILRDGHIMREDLWVRDSKIVNPEPVFYDEKVIADLKIDCGNALIVPGFIDLQINGGFGFDFSTPKEDIATSINMVAKGILQHGVTSFCPTLITSTPDKYREIIPKIKIQNGGKHGAGVLGIHVEGPFINKEKRGAHPIQHVKSLKNGIDDVINTYGTLYNIRIITLAPELDVKGSVIEELVRQGITVSLGHSTCSLSDGEKAVAHGASFITHLFNAMLPFHHRDPGLVGLLTSEKLPPNKKIFYGIIADGIHTHPAALRIAYNANPKGLVLVTDAMSAMGLQPGTYNIGDQKVDVTNTCAVVSGTQTLSGSIATMDSCIRFLLKSVGCSLVEAIECATLHPAQVLGITKSKGTLNFGTDADFVFLNSNLEVEATYINGSCVWSKDFDAL
ncbi:n-acetylglucosamine-6-phosphate deacetylase [Trichonephila inaurata madagascariensis]|uniref:N-acetylglucosamine-6-phosphate deacetylase n=1 Tax=Trichonephila inaurata madagascariensis TaxID=2747483 RepID=A0A8X6MEM2_9ARAC|nr:n-acetylglucosamine-6-phosphate deacetylase [Trichonephila inaurata madagascariensis]